MANEVATETVEPELSRSDKAVGIEASGGQEESRIEATATVGKLLKKAEKAEKGKAPDTTGPADKVAPAEKKQVSEKPEPEKPVLDPALVRRAKSLGWNDDEITGFLSSESLEGTLTAWDRRMIRQAKTAQESQQRTQPQPSPSGNGQPAPPAPAAQPTAVAAPQPQAPQQTAAREVDFSALEEIGEDHDPVVQGLGKTLKAVHEQLGQRLQAYEQESTQTRQAVAQIVQHLRQQESRNYVGQLDSWIKASTEEFGDIIGDGPAMELAGDSEYHANLKEIISAATALRSAYPNGQGPGFNELHSRAARSVFHERLIKKARQTAGQATGERARNAVGQYLPDEANRPVTPEPAGDPKQASTRGVAEILQRARDA